MKKGILIPLACVALAVGFVSCLEGSNTTSSTNIPAVVGYNLERGGKTLLISGGELSVSSSESSKLSGYEQGDCVLADIFIDYDNQPSAYTTASRISVVSVDKNSVQIQTGEELTLDFPVKSIIPVRKLYDLAAHPNFGGNFFLWMNYDAAEKQLVDYTMIVQPGTGELKDHPATLYLFARKLNETDGTSGSKNKVHAFNIETAIAQLGRDTTLSNVEKYRFLEVQMKYCSGLTEEEKPIYSDYQPVSSSSVFGFYMYK